VAEELGASTVAFPAVSAGVYGWPVDDVARIAVETARAHDAGSVHEVRFVLFGPETHAAFAAWIG
jgi:O-acetyl-ADP-ribose deacetylase (regulator of RNase III)